MLHETTLYKQIIDYELSHPDKAILETVCVVLVTTKDNNVRDLFAKTTKLQVGNKLYKAHLTMLRITSSDFIVFRLLYFLLRFSCNQNTIVSKNSTYSFKMPL